MMGLIYKIESYIGAIKIVFERKIWRHFDGRYMETNFVTTICF